MNNTITLTDEQMKALQSGKPITIEPPKPVITKWEPKGGCFCIYADFSVDLVQLPSNKYHNSGMTFNSQQQAEQAAKALRSYARQLAWLAENDDGWVADWTDDTQNKYRIVYYINNDNGNKYSYYCTRDVKSPDVIFMSETNAIKLCNLLNSGIVEF